MLRHQLPARSPVPPGALLRTAPILLGIRTPDTSPTEALRGLLTQTTPERTAWLTSSGTHALTLAIRIAARRADGPVALPAYSCFDLITAAVAADVRLVFYDIDPDTLGPDMGSLASALEAGAAAVVVAPLYGLTLNWNAIGNLVRQSGALLIEDAAQAFGALHQGAGSGSFGDLAVFSFGRGKGWTGGRGGALLLGEEFGAEVVQELAGIASAGRSGGWLRATAACVLGRPALYGLPASLPWLKLGQTVYHEPSACTAMDEVTAALALATHAQSQHEVRLRRINAGAYRKELRTGTRWRHVLTHPDSKPSWLRYPLRLMTGNRIASRRALLRLGIAPGYPAPLPELPAAVYRTVATPRYPGATELVRTLITLPTHGGIARRERERVRLVLVESQAAGPDWLHGERLSRTHITALQTARTASGQQEVKG